MTPAEVAAHRRLTGLTGDQLATQLGVNPRALRAWESGRDVMPEGAAADLRTLVQGNRALARRMATADTVVVIPRGDGHDGFPPGWYLQAAAMALVLEPDLMLEWDTPAEESPRRRY